MLYSPPGGRYVLLFNDVTLVYVNTSTFRVLTRVALSRRNQTMLQQFSDCCADAMSKSIG